MSKTHMLLQRYDHLSSEELEARLQHEEDCLSSSSPTEQLYLLHELRVYQIELEMQNRELRAMHTELEVARDRYASLYDFAPIAYFTLDKNGIIQQINLAGVRLFEQDSLAIVGYPFLRFLDKSESSRFFRYLRRVFESRGESFTQEFHLHSAHGHVIEASLQSILVQEADTRRWVCRTALIDLTQQRRAEEEAEAHRDALAHATRVSKLGEMTSGLVHEVSQPMSAIITYSGIMQRLLNEGGATQKDLLSLGEKIAAQAQRSVDLLNQLREFSRPQHLKKSPQSITRLIEEALSLIGPKLRHSGVRIVIRAVPDLPMVYVDPVQITQVLINLLCNALDAIREQNKPGAIYIRAYVTGKHRMQVSVRDNGPGIAAALAGQLFMPFKTSKEHGLGIGLPLSRSIIEAHGGQMWLVAGSAVGANLVFTLPIGRIERQYDE